MEYKIDFVREKCEYKKVNQKEYKIEIGFRWNFEFLFVVFGREVFLIRMRND
jgi:hypothetical protein